MDLEAVRVFVRVAELGNFTRASEQLGLSKARASIRVQELEAELGCRLFHRSTRAVRITEDGELFERFSDDPYGEWSPVELPERQLRKRQRRKPKS